MKADALAQAISKARHLPVADQERIGEDFGKYLDDLASLRGQLDQGIRSLDAGLGIELDIEQVIARARSAYGKK